jgi:hypothetical protein
MLKEFAAIKLLNSQRLHIIDTTVTTSYGNHSGINKDRKLRIWVMDEPVEERDFHKCQPNREHFVN